jgi:segregation and condensation protein A
VPDALVRIRQMLGELPDGAPLERFLPLSEAGHVSALQRRAALASTLLAGLELSRDGATVIEQHQAFGEIRLGPAGSCVTGTVPTRDSAAA